MISIIDHIQYLISRHDCVIVPGLGAFVARYVPAAFSADGRTLSAPSRIPSFNSALTHDDGLLAGSIARRNGISYEAAKKEMQQEVELLYRRVVAGEAVVLPRVGVLELNADGAIVFAPVSADGVVSMMYCGLPTELQLSPIVSVAAESTTSDVKILEVDVATASKHRYPRRVVWALKYAASVAILLGIGFTMSTPVLVDGDSVNLASLATPSVEKPKVVSDADSKSEATPELVILKPDAALATSSVMVPAEDIVSDDAAEMYRYFVIVASCTSRSDAHRYIKRNGGEQSMRVLKRDGRYRVYVAASNDYDDAMAFRTADAEFAEKHPEAWVYSRY